MPSLLLPHRKACSASRLPTLRFQKCRGECVLWEEEEGERRERHREEEKK
jgi:hypothetical protein